jgi:hypothetical protein
MAPYIVRHVTRRACRDSIRQHGILPNRPAKGQACGVYVYNNDFMHPCFRSRTLWIPDPKQDIWEIAYIGPAMNDPWVHNALVLLGPVDHIRLVEA